MLRRLGDANEQVAELGLLLEVNPRPQIARLDPPQERSQRGEDDIRATTPTTACTSRDASDIHKNENTSSPTNPRRSTAPSNPDT